MQGLRQDDPMPDQSPATEAQSVGAMDSLIANESLGRIWIIEVAQQAVGYAALTFVHSIEFGGRCAFVDELYVAPEHRGHGVGRRTLEMIVEESRRLNVRTLLLEVSPENERARRLYELVGFGQRKYNLLVQRIS
jgi:ribosomal protein S18 acetylase RimI-like enzyme